MTAAARSDFAEVVTAYWEHYRLFTSDVRADRLQAGSRFYAVLDVEDIARDDDLVVPLFEALANAAPDLQALAYLGAGPIEDRLRHWGRPTDRVLDRIDGAAQRNEKFRAALRCVWWDEHDDAGLVARFRRFGPPL